MKILQIATFKVGACGPTSVLIPLIERLNNEDNTVDVFSTCEFDEGKKQLLDKLGANYYFKKDKLIINRKKLLEIIPNITEYDIIHIHGVFNIDNIVISKIISELGIPYIVSTHGNLMKYALEHSRIKKKIAVDLFIRKMLRNAKYVHALCEEEYNDLKEGFNLNNINIIYNGVEPISDEYIYYNRTSKIKNILFIGRLDIHHKGLDLLFDAIELNPSWCGKLHIFLVGPFDSIKDKEIIENRIKNNIILNDIIKIEGPKYYKEKNKYYEECQAFIHTSRYEGMPMAVLEAMQHGMPCIVTKQTNMANIINKSNGGIVIDCNVESISKGIDFILKMEESELNKMGNNSYKWSNENLNWDILVLKYKNMYSSI